MERPEPIGPNKTTKPKRETRHENRKNNQEINVGCWNIRRGLVIREKELMEIIKENSLDIVFLTETDTSSVNNENDYLIAGFKTLVQNKKETSSPTRIICLINERLKNSVSIRNDLTSTEFPSLWLEIENAASKNIICGGFYREWAPGGLRTTPAQIEAILCFTNQIERATHENKTVIIVGDANLCSDKWNSPTFQHKQVADELKNTLVQCGLHLIPLGVTYIADRLSPENQEITSALDHAYVTSGDEHRIHARKIENSATDHLPIIVSITTKDTTRPAREKRPATIKRSFKDFTKTRWIDALRNQDWSEISSTNDIETKTRNFTNKVVNALDECAPFKSFKPRDSFRPGLTNIAKKLIKERDSTRISFSKAKTEDKPKLRAKYRQLRNKVVNQIRSDTLQQNGERISKAANEGESWKIVNEIIKPRSVNNITIHTAGGETNVESEVATALNNFFVEKINSLKANIDPNLVRDPLEKIRKKFEGKNLHFSLKTVTIRKVEKVMKKMAKKKSKGKDGISQECLLLGQEALAAPLTAIINQSIETGVFPRDWKESIVVPILKKGDPKDPKNYRPVSCLAAASKVLEKIVCDQLTRFVETNKILPNNQHGFRKGRSTMTALSAMQKEWIQNTEQGLTTGVLVWDLSAAFDTMDIGLFIRKLTLYGADQKTRDWFESFLTGRTQRVKIGDALSSPVDLASGVPQGGILSPIIFTLYTADLELWLTTSRAFNFADDTTTDNKSKDKNEVRSRLEVDATNVLSFMASNGLVANQSKTEFLLLNEKNASNQPLNEIKVGDTFIQRTQHTKLLGMQIEESQEWNVHLRSLTSSLNQRLFTIRRVSHHIPKCKLMNVVHSLWVSKLRYGLQLCTKVQQKPEERIPALMKSLQLSQNRLLRLLNNSRVSDKISTKLMLEKYNLPSVNQLAAEIKLTETWKSINVDDCPIKLNSYNCNLDENRIGLRPQQNRIFNDSYRLQIAQSSFHVDSAKLWNYAPTNVQCAKTLTLAKKAIKEHCKSLPI